MQNPALFLFATAGGILGVPVRITSPARTVVDCFRYRNKIGLDVDLMQNALGVQSSIILENSIMQINAGSVAEQYVAQELLACADPYSD